jgi:hypothetical protein
VPFVCERQSMCRIKTQLLDLNHQRIHDMGDDQDEPARIICGPSVTRGYLRPGQTIRLLNPRAPVPLPSARSRMAT